jgi:hypothetical protein
LCNPPRLSSCSHSVPLLPPSIRVDPCGVGR